jgi:peptidoglycan/LPS O-acetylase OafA/YrhL
MTHPSYRPDIDGLRAIAVLSVVGFHAFGIQAGFIGVDIFFVISGYLISSILFSDLQKDQFSLLDFYRRRIKRIFPALLAVLLFCFTLGWFTLLADEFTSLNKHIAAGLAFTSNLVLLGESGYFDGASHNKILLHLWSLGIEEQFYIFWPLLLLIFWRLRLKLGMLLWGLLLCSFLLNVDLIYSQPSATFYLPFTRVWELLIGAALAYRVAVQNKPFLLGGSSNLNSWLGLTLLIIANIFINDRSAFPGWWALLPTIGAALLISAGSFAWFNQHILSNRVLVWFGLISYPLYLWHWPMLTFARILDGGRQPSSLVRICMVLLAILLAWLTYRFIEKPIRFNQKTFFTPARLFIVGALFFCISSYIYFNSGLPNRTAAQLKILNDGDIGHDEFRTYLHAKPNYCEYKDVTPAACGEKFSSFKRIIAVVGDSHAEHILLGVSDAMPEVAFMLFDTNQTLPFVSSALSNHFFDVIDGNSKIDAVVLVAYWHLRKDLIAPGSSYLQEIITTAQKLSNHGKKVFLVDGTPNFSFLPTKCKYEWPFLRIQQCSEITLFAKQHSQYFADFQEAEKVAPIKLIGLMPLFCSGDTCTMAKDGKLFFRDDNHLSINGSRYIGPTLVDSLILTH